MIARIDCLFDEDNGYNRSPYQPGVVAVVPNMNMRAESYRTGAERVRMGLVRDHLCSVVDIEDNILRVGDYSID
jgi:hypothetical protein